VPLGGLLAAEPMIRAQRLATPLDGRGSSVQIDCPRTPHQGYPLDWVCAALGASGVRPGGAHRGGREDSHNTSEPYGTSQLCSVM
jgi:hypothetical protein